MNPPATPIPPATSIPPAASINPKPIKSAEERRPNK
jgi:hypothetical protein